MSATKNDKLLWTSRASSKEEVQSPHKNFGGWKLKIDGSHYRKTKNAHNYPDKFYEGFYFRGKTKNEALSALPGDANPKPKTFKTQPYNKKRVTEFFNIKNTPGPGSYQVNPANSFMIKKPESLNGYQAFSTKSHGLT